MEIISLEEIEKMSKQSELIKKPDIMINVNAMEDWWSNIPKIDKKGLLIKYPHGCVVKQSDSSDYYRGENEFHDNSPSSFMRHKENYSVAELELETFISDMQIYEFKNLIYKFDHVKKWEEKTADILFEPLAQHYGIATKWIDITNDFDVALFFACCWWNKDEKKWEPIVYGKDDKVEDKKKYGTIFVQNHMVARDKLTNTSRPFNSFEHVILPIGFQPFMRCHMQSAYGMYSDSYYDLRSDPQFKILKFEHNEDLSKWIFDKMKQGKLIYPDEGLLECEDQIELIKDKKRFSYEAFEYAFNKNKDYWCNEKTIKNRLPAKIEIGKSPINVSQQSIDTINLKYKNINPLVGIDLFSMLTYL